MIEVKKNRFYKEKSITTGMTLYPRFKDFSKSQDNNYLLNGGYNATVVVLSGSVPDSPTVGGGELDSAFLQVYCTGMSLSGATTLPEMEVYLLQDNIEGKEGGFSIGTTIEGSTVDNPVAATSTNLHGAKLAIYSAYLDPEIPWMEESFDGSNKSFGTALIQDTDRAASSIKDLYISAQDGEDIIFAGGDAFFGGGASDDVSHNLKKYFSDPAAPDKVRVKPLKKNRIQGIWTAVHDNRNEKQKWQIYAPYWKWKQLASKVKVSTPVPPAGANTKEMPDVSTNNTIFNDIYASPILGNVLTTDSSSAPLISSKIEISSEKKSSGGSSLMCHHEFTYTSGKVFMSNMEASLGRHNRNPQTIKAGMWNIPKPVPLDVGGFGYAPFSGSSVLSGNISGTMDGVSDDEIAYGAHIADKRMSLPEITFTMNIEKLLPSPAINFSRANADFGYGNGSGTIYYRACTNNADSTVVTPQIAVGADVWKDSRGGLRTFWRSVVITWSSYKASAFNCLDDFIDYGMRRFYMGGTAAVGWKNDVQLGGIVFQRLMGNAEFNLSGAASIPDAQDANIGNIYAYALPVTAWNGTVVGAGGVSSADTGLYASGGMASIGNEGAAAATPGSTARKFLVVHDPRVLTEAVASREPHWVELPQDGWIKMKMVFDVNAPWGKKTYSKVASPFEMRTYWDPAGHGDTDMCNYISYGTPAVAYFDGCVSGSLPGYGLTNKSDQLTGSLDDNKPYIVMPFMCRNDNTADSTTVDATQSLDGAQTFVDGPTALNAMGNSTTSNRYTGSAQAWKQSPWVRHMTIWVNGYRWHEYATDSNDPDYMYQGVTGTVGAGAFASYRGADSRLYESGSAPAETKVFIDDIEFKYFNNEITNHSAPAGKIQQFINFKNPVIKSPLITRYDDNASAADPDDADMLRDMNREGNLYGRRTGMGLTIGFDNYQELINATTFSITAGLMESAGTPTSAFGNAIFSYFLWNNFSTQNFENNTRLVPTAAWLTTAPPPGTTSQTTNNEYASGVGLGWRDRAGAQCWGSQWGNNGYASVIPRVLTADSTNDLSSPSQETGKYQAFWQGHSMWYGGASGTTLAKGGYDFHGGSNVVAKYAAVNTADAGYGWVSVNATGLPELSVAPTVSAAGYRNPYFTGTTRAMAGHTLFFGTGATGESFGSNDGLTQKGFMGFGVDFTSGAATQTTEGGFTWNRGEGGSGDHPGMWGKRENIWASAKILAVPGSPGLNMADDEADLDDNAIIVDQPRIILPDDEDCEYVIYRGGHASTSKSGAKQIFSGTKWVNVSDRPYLKICKLAMDKVNAQGTEGALYFDQSMTNLASYDCLDELWISPFKYWLNMVFVGNDNGDWVAADGFLSGSEQPQQLDYTRSYESIVTVNQRVRTGAGVDIAALAGSTYNEWTYSYDDSQSDAGVRALITKPWILDPGSEQTSLIIDKDFGFGSYDEEKNDGAQLGKSSSVKGTYTDIELKGLIKEEGVAPNERVNLVLGLSNQVSSKEVTLIGDDNSSVDGAFLPTLIWEYIDDLPQVSKFTVKPAFEALKQDVDLYSLSKENVNNVLFEWDEAADDVWYRMLLVDSKNIANKYTNAFFWAPLNVSSSTIGAKPAYNEYDMTATPVGYPDAGTTLTVGSEVRAKITGLAGYAAYTKAHADGEIIAASQMQALTEYTFMVHLIPSAADGTVWVIAEGDPATKGFGIKIDSGYVKAYTSGSIATGTTALPLDGETPVCIIVTYKENSEIGPDFRLYINGALEDYVLAPDPCTNDSPQSLIIGGSGSAGTYAGAIEEIVIYNKEIPILEDAGAYLYNPSPLTEVSSEKYVPQHARLFIMDYHNIRGTSRDEVAMSNQVSWKVTTV